MKQVLVEKGSVIVEDVPAPVLENGSVLVEVQYSLISSGTETATVASSGMPLLRRAMKHSNEVRHVLDSVKTQGIMNTVDTVRDKLAFAKPIGYSCAGVAIGVGRNVRGIEQGDKVACAGSGYASHAEVVCVPRNLVAKMPDTLDFKQAASVTLGAIAMQGVRRALPTFGETIAVIGLGLVGQITIQILKVAGCRVVGADLVKSRVELAQDLGMDSGVVIGETDPVDHVIGVTSGMGADATIITAATKSDTPVQQAMAMTRKKGRVIVVGDVGLHLHRQPLYEKEIDLLISCSYGPGRHDDTYEEKGIDYPYAYVRWTENRNMQEYLKMLAERKVDFGALISKEYDIADAPEAYRELEESEHKPLGVLLKYSEVGEARNESDALGVQRRILVNTKSAKKKGPINVAVIGAGEFAQAVHLPNLRKLSDLYNIRTIVTRRGSNARQIARRFGADFCATDYQTVLQDENVDMVLIATRHNLHAQMAMEAARAGKAVFLEKPMALNQEELGKLVDVLEQTQVPFTVGFNRRFSPISVRAKEIISQRHNPLIINYRVNAGYLPLDHWVHTEEGGGRIIGEACHMLDLFNYFTGSEVQHIYASAIRPKTADISSRDNFVATLRYHDGSVCSLTYTALGSREAGKEYMEVYAEGNMLIIDDFRVLRVYASKTTRAKSRRIQKGHLEEMVAFAKYFEGNHEVSIPLKQLISATRVSFTIDNELTG